MTTNDLNQLRQRGVFVLRGSPLLGLVAGCLLGGVATVEAAIFAKIEDIEGESVAVGHEGWIDVEGLGSKVSQDREVIDGVAQLSPKAEAFVFHKRIDKASPYLVLAMLKGQVFDELQVEQTSGGRLVGCYRMRGVRLDQHRLQTDENGPLEQLGFGFDVIEWHYFKDAEDPESVSHVGTTWDFATGVGGNVEQHGTEAPTIAPIAPIETTPGSRIAVAVKLIDPAGNPENLVLKALSSEMGLVKVVRIGGQGEFREIELEVSALLNGTDRVTLSVSDGERSSTRILPIIIAGQRTPYEAYIEGFLGEEIKLNPELADLLRDPDKDRMSNFMEFYLGTNPGVFTPSNEAMTFEQVKSKDGTQLRMRFFRRVDTGGLVEGFEGSRDFKNWKGLGPNTEPPLEMKVLSNGDGTYVPVEARVDVDGVKDPSFFLRLSVEGTF